MLLGAPGLESGEIEKDNISITYALPFSRTIPVRTPQSASRTEVSRPLCHGRAPGARARTQRPGLDGPWVYPCLVSCLLILCTVVLNFENLLLSFSDFGSFWTGARAVVGRGLVYHNAFAASSGG